MKVYPYAAAIINAIIVGLSFLFTKLALDVSSPITTLAYRFSIAWLALTCLCFFSPKIYQVKLNGKKSLFSLISLALFYPTFFFSFQAFGLNFATSAEGGIIIAFSPALTALLAAYFLKERVNKQQLLFIFLSIFGVVYIFLMDGISPQLSNKVHSLGILLLVFSSLSLAGYTVMARYLSISFSPIQLTYIMVTFGFITFNLSAIIQHIVNGELIDFLSLIVQPNFFLSVLFLGLFATMCTAFLSNYILSKLSASKMSIFANLSTIISIIAGAILLRETIQYYHIVGSALIIIGVAGTNFLKDSKVKIAKKIAKSS